jgi:hypothetical protein
MLGEEELKDPVKSGRISVANADEEEEKREIKKHNGQTLSVKDLEDFHKDVGDVITLTTNRAKNLLIAPGGLKKVSDLVLN